MAVRIRLRRTGKRNAPAHRIVVVDSRSPRDGRFIEILGHYDPRNGAEQVDVERADYWLSVGAQPSETVSAIIKRAKAGAPLQPKTQKPEVTAPPPAPKAEAEPETESAPQSAETPQDETAVEEKEAADA